LTEQLFPGLFIAAALGGLALRFAFGPDRRIKRVLRQVRPTAIAAARDGQAVKIVGQLVHASSTIATPIFDRACAFYSILVHEHPVQLGEIFREDKGVDFYLRDGSSMALVRASMGEARAAVVRDRRAHSSTLYDPNANVERFVAERRIPSKVFLSSRSLTVSEGVLVAGMRIAVAGLARWEPDPDASGGNYREMPKRLVLEASEALPLFLSDDPSTF
jgi:hypothetical protein